MIFRVSHVSSVCWAALPLHVFSTESHAIPIAPKLFRLLLTVAAFCLLVGRLNASDSWSLHSPDKRLAVTVRLVDLSSMPRYPVGKRLYYKIEQGPAEARVEVLPISPLGIGRKDQTLVEGLTLDSAQRIRQIDETYEMPHGKRILFG